MTAARTPAQQGRASRSKGARGELEAAAILSKYSAEPVTRLVRRHGKDCDLVGLHGWAVEVKRVVKANRSDIDRWWGQTVIQACEVHRKPLLMIRIDRQGWQCFWPAGVWDDRISRALNDECWLFENTLSATPDVWAYSAMEDPATMP